MLQWFNNLFGLTRNTGYQDRTPVSIAGNNKTPAVTFNSAMSVSASWACVRLLSETVASLPLEIKTAQPDGTYQIDTQSNIAQVFEGKVNRYQNKQEFLETLMLNLVINGNAYVIKQYSGSRLVGLLPLMSEQVKPELLRDGSIVYHYQTETIQQVYASDTILHIKLFGNGITGLSPLDYARHSLGIAMSGDRRVQNLITNKGTASGVLTMDQSLTDEQRRTLRQNFTEFREGDADLMVLEAGASYKPISFSPNDLELLQTRRLATEDICRFFGVPSVLVNDTSSSTTWGSGIYQILQGFYKLNLRPYLDRLENAFTTDLLTSDQRKRIKIKFNFDELLRANQQERFDGLNKAIHSGILTPNEARQRENLEQKEYGDQLLINSTLIPLDQVRQTNNKNQ